MLEREPFLPNIPILWGDNRHDDAPAIRLLLRGVAVYDMRSGEMIVAPTLNHLPHGSYRTVAPTR